MTKDYSSQHLAHVLLVISVLVHAKVHFEDTFIYHHTLYMISDKCPKSHLVFQYSGQVPYTKHFQRACSEKDKGRSIGKLNDQIECREFCDADAECVSYEFRSDKSCQLSSSCTAKIMTFNADIDLYVKIAGSY